MNLPQPNTNTNIHKTNLIFLIGSMGSGKTYWGKFIAAKKHIDFIDLDKAIEKKSGMSITDIFETKGEKFFRKKETETLSEIISKKQTAIIATGGGTACFNDNIKLMNDNGITIWLNESISKIVERVTQFKDERPLLKNIPDNKLYTYLKSLATDRETYYNKCQYQLYENQICEPELLQIINQYA